VKPIIPAVRGVIARRILLDWRVRPEVAGRLLPAPFRPSLVGGWAMAGVCLIRLERMRPAFLPGAFGIASENGAHWIAVEWGKGPARRQGVFVPRRYTDSRLQRLLGGRLFPGPQRAASFRILDDGDRIRIEMRSREGGVLVRLDARASGGWPSGSVFGTLEEASTFFESGSRGWSPCSRGEGLEGLDLRTEGWRVEPLRVDQAESSFFADPASFPPGSTELDCALIMRGIPHEWRPLGPLFPRGRRRRSRCAFFDIP
jgi:hypothetical protein